MRVTVVGSGTAAPEADRVGSGYLIESRATRLLLDCGPGVVHHLARFDLPWPRLDHVFLTHFHNDHTGDLPMLLFALKWGVRERRTAALGLWGPHGLHERLRAMQAAFGDHVADPGFPLVIREIEPGDHVRLGDLDVRAAKTPHTDESLAYRVEGADGVAVGYTGDTGPSEDVARFMAGVDVLIAECSLADDEAMETHLTPGRLAAMAAIANPGTLLVTHVYPRLGDQAVGRVAEAGWGGGILRARDGLTVPAAGSPVDLSPRPV